MVNMQSSIKPIPIRATVLGPCIQINVLMIVLLTQVFVYTHKDKDACMTSEVKSGSVRNVLFITPANKVVAGGGGGVHFFLYTGLSIYLWLLSVYPSAQ